MRRGRDGGDREGAGPGWGHRRKAQGLSKEQIAREPSVCWSWVSIPALELRDRDLGCKQALGLWCLCRVHSVLEAPHYWNLGTGFASRQPPREAQPTPGSHQSSAPLLGLSPES